MATVYPSVKPDYSDRVSRAERDVLDVLSKLPDDWCVIHSLWLKTHEVKLHAEADFILVTDRAVFILEVKGGNVWRSNDGWHFAPKAGGAENVKREGPFEQARGAYYAIREHLYRLGDNELFDDHVWGYGVICPECSLHIPDSDTAVSPRLLLDERAFPAGVKNYIEELTDCWISLYRDNNRNARGQRARHADEISQKRRGKIVNALRPEFELLVGPAALSVHSESNLVRLTENQLGALDFISLEPRNILVGSAGTGKTILCIEQARRKAQAGLKVLIVCFNKLLANKIKSELGVNQYSGNVTVGNYHKIAADLYAKKGMAIVKSDDWSDFQRFLSENLEELCALLNDGDLYDYIIVDEAQDLMVRGFMDLLDIQLRNGLSKGSWMMACDTDQTIFRDNFDQSLLEKLFSQSRKTALTINCRNTRQIAAYVTGLSRVGSITTRGVEGENPIIRYYEDFSGYLRLFKEVVNKLIQSFVDARLDVSEIVVLYATNKFIPDEVLKPGFFLRRVNHVGSQEKNAVESIQLCSVQGYKGLEAKAIVLVGIEEISSNGWRELFYVGASRAKTNLRILLPSTNNDVRLALDDIYAHLI